MVLKIKKEMKLKDILVVKEFSDVFPEEIPGLPFKRDVDCEIELESGAHPISKPPYRMGLVELKELKVQTKRLYKTKRISLESISAIHEKEGWNLETLYRLQRIE